MAIRLRRRGRSYGEILKIIKVSRFSLNIWLREIDLTSEQKNRILNKSDRIRYEVAKSKVIDRIKRTNRIVEKIKEEARFLKNYTLFLVGTVLYWAEGAKIQVEKVKFANSDAKMVALMMKWFRQVCKVPDAKFRIHVHITYIAEETFWNIGQKLLKYLEDNFTDRLLKKPLLAIEKMCCTMVAVPL